MASTGLIDLSRWQFATTAAFHMTFPALSVGLAIFLVICYASYCKQRLHLPQLIWKHAGPWSEVLPAVIAALGVGHLLWLQDHDPCRLGDVQRRVHRAHHAHEAPLLHRAMVLAARALDASGWRFRNDRRLGGIRERSPTMVGQRKAADLEFGVGTEHRRGHREPDRVLGHLRWLVHRVGALCDP
ncbi:MAG: cytochrome bd ubiquinol oxidase subunit [Frankiales bacterium]|nr:cytochrome bd ubiquinol oxidase subunit [Frankiales bacterium]